jgi:hypothetical protein
MRGRSQEERQQNITLSKQAFFGLIMGAISGLVFTITFGYYWLNNPDIN